MSPRCSTSDSIRLKCSNLAKKEIKSEANRHRNDGLKPAMTYNWKKYDSTFLSLTNFIHSSISTEVSLP